MIGFNRLLVRGAGAVALAAALAQLAARPVQAQANGDDSRWTAWLGCWEPRASDPTEIAPVLCIVPSGQSSTADIMTYFDGKQISTQRIQADGSRVPVARNGCEGWETAQWSADRRRLYLKSDVSCRGRGRMTSSGIFAISPAGEWIDVRSVTSEEVTGLSGDVYRLARNRPSDPAVLPNPVIGVADARAARDFAGTPIGAREIIEATRSVEAGVVQAWLVTRGIVPDLDASELVTLADAGVPGTVTDVILALTYPRTLALDLGSLERLRPASSEDDLGYETYGRVARVTVGRDPYDSYGYPRYGYGSVYGYSPYGSPYGYGRTGLGLGWYRAPHFVVTRGGAADLHGRAVNGRGYTRGDGSSGGKAVSPRPRPSAGSSGGSSGGGSKGSGGRKAKPRR